MKTQMPHPGDLVVKTTIAAQLVHLLFKTPADAKIFLDNAEIEIELNHRRLVRRKKAEKLLFSLTDKLTEGFFLQLPIRVSRSQKVTVKVWHGNEVITLPTK